MILVLDLLHGRREIAIQNSKAHLMKGGWDVAS